jgi:hypothetical protein
VTVAVSLSDKSVLDFKIDLQAKQVVVIQRGEVGVETGRIILPMEDIKSWGLKLKNLSSILPLDMFKKV